MLYFGYFQFYQSNELHLGVLHFIFIFYLVLIVCVLPQALDSSLAPYDGALTWLFSLRDSFLFLSMWRSVGRESGMKYYTMVTILEALKT